MIRNQYWKKKNFSQLPKQIKRKKNKLKYLNEKRKSEMVPKPQLPKNTPMKRPKLYKKKDPIR